MEFIKKTYLSIVPIFILIMAISFGICVILGDNTFSTVTYLSKHENYFMGQTITTYDYDLASYVANLTTRQYFENFETNLFNVNWFRRIMDLVAKANQIKDQSWWEQIVKVLYNIYLILVMVVNMVIMALNILIILPLQLIIIILLHVFSLIGLNMSTDWILPTVLKWINANFYIPAIML